MTDNISPNDIDRAQIAEYIEEYNQTDDREEQRRIENDILAETVWKTPERPQGEEIVLSEAEIERLNRHIPDDAREAKRILRSFYVERL